jgi:NADPH-dependent ferric siderophore reductase
MSETSGLTNEVRSNLDHLLPPTTTSGSGHGRPSSGHRSFLAEVIQTTWLAPRIRRVTLGGTEIAEFVSAGADQRVKLFLPRPHQTAPLIPTGPHGWRRAWHAQPAAERPVPRTYTIRRHRPDRGEVDIDFIVRPDGGPACDWARRAQPGDRVGMYGPGAAYRPPEDAGWQLLVGDDAALPAIAAILESLPTDSHAEVYLEAADDHERRYVPTPDGARVTWIPRGDSPHERSRRLLDAVRTARLPAGTPYAWIAGELATVTGLRHHLIHDRGLDHRAVYACRYWHRDGPTDEC